HYHAPHMEGLEKYAKYVFIIVVVLVVAEVVRNHYFRRPEATPVSATDKDVQKQVQSAIADSGSFKHDKITVEVHNGIAFLKGTVSEGWKQSSAANLASTIPGVTEVQNSIQVKEGAKAPEEAPWVPDDASVKKHPYKQPTDTPELKAQALVEEGNRLL